MAEPRQKNFVERLADVGEEAIQRIGSAPGGDKIVGTIGSMRDRLDELTRRVRGLEDMEKRIDVLERRVDKLEGKPERPAAGSASDQPKKASTATRKPKAQEKAAESTPSSPGGDST
jgi:TolA-binding protein